MVNSTRPKTATHFAVKVVKPWGWELHWTAAELPYVGKLLHIWANSRLSLQVHESKTESWTLISGRCRVLIDDEDGNLEDLELQPGAGYTCPAGRRHRLIGVTDCEIIEVSTPEAGVTRRLEDDFGRPDETDAQRALERAA